MAVRSCPRCRSLFQYTSGDPICQKCKDLEEREFQVVRKFVRDNPKSTISETSKETHVSTKLIVKFIKQDRLQVSPESPMVVECERCGEMIKSGKFCKACAKELAQGLGNHKQPAKRPAVGTPRDTSPKMHFLNKENINKRS